MESSIVLLMTVPTKTIKVDSDTHRRLKLMSAKSGKHVYEVVARLVKEASNDKRRQK